jgi:hypothetical protein
MSYNLPYESEVMVMADDPDGAAEMVKLAVNADEMPSETNFKITSCELIEENVDVDDSEVAESYRQTNKRTLN